ncbi:MAG: hypothetical protein LBW85_04375 [Deltaproteobacteria bacterium]|nr:hypothetical protein [Deltaproteobacteria bacterium]
MEVFKIAGLTYLTDHGDPLTKFTVDEIAKMNREEGPGEGLGEGPGGGPGGPVECRQKAAGQKHARRGRAELTGLEAAAIENIT